MSYSRAYDAAHCEQNSIRCNRKRQSNYVHIVVETATDNVPEAHEVLSEHLAIHASQDTVSRVSESIDSSHIRANLSKIGLEVSNILVNGSSTSSRCHKGVCNSYAGVDGSKFDLFFIIVIGPKIC